MLARGALNMHLLNHTCALRDVPSDRSPRLDRSSVWRCKIARPAPSSCKIFRSKLCESIANILQICSVFDVERTQTSDGVAATTIVYDTTSALCLIVSVVCLVSKKLCVWRRFRAKFASATLEFFANFSRFWRAARSTCIFFTDRALRETSDVGKALA